MSTYTPTIGLEVHAELKTRTKMFCNSKNAPHESAPNTHVCPVCMAHPGTLPTVNKEAVAAVLKVGAALDATLADYSEFDRKSYFYPDIPKNYQISQYEHPLVSGGSLKDVAITRVHLEEDTARSSHLSEGKAGKDGHSLVDFNRAGVPLMELVTEPVIHDAKTASSFARELQLLLRTLGVSEANLEKGEMRVEANISISKDSEMGTKVEVKNLNSFKAVEKAIEFEIARQEKLIESGEKVIQETRGWDENKGITFSQRMKEGSTDYRYFPEPDIPKLRISDVDEWRLEALKASLPELPKQRRARYEQLGLKKEDIDTIAVDIERSKYFDELLERLGESRDKVLTGVNYLVNDIGAGEPPEISSFVELIEMISAGELSSRGAKDVLKAMAEGDTSSPADIAENKQLLQNSDPEAVRALVRAVIDREEEAAAQYKQGKASILEFLVGSVMKESKGTVNPVLARKMVIEELS